MTKYEMSQIGNIVLLKNIIFENSITNKKEVDHAWKTGRPCLIIYSDNEYEYFLTMKSCKVPDKYENHHFKITTKDLIEYKNIKKFHQQSVINLENIYKMPISGHQEIGKVRFESYKKIIEKLKEYHENINFKEIIKKSTLTRI